MFALKNTGFTKEQLTSLGVTKESMQTSVHSTSAFPALNCRPIEIKSNPSIDYKIVWKEEFRSHLHDIHGSNSEIKMSENVSYSSEMANAFEKEHKKKMHFRFAYSQMPLELRSQAYKKKLSLMKHPVNAKRLKKDPDLQEKLRILEEKELEKPEQPETQTAAKENESDDEFDENDEQAEDQEMDEGDYENNYFDNGEGYNDEDDNLDDGDGPVY